MAKLIWDHTIHLVNDLDKAVELFLQQGLNAQRGGSHADWGTYNALSYFDLNYIEFLSIENREIAEKTEDYNVVARDPLVYLPEHEIFNRVVIRTDNIQEIADRIQASGLKTGPITPGKRLNTEGRWIEWKMVTVYGNYEGLNYPFFIEWKDSDEQRLEDLKKSGLIKPHSVGDITTDYALFHVNNPKETSDHWHQAFGFEPAAWDQEGEFALDAGDGKKFVFRQGAEPQIKEVAFRTSNSDLKGKTFAIGGGTYRFE